MYTVTQRIAGVETVSRYFETIRAARRWFKWVCGQTYAESAALYKGAAGGELIERKEIR